jgi:uncharacterized membrane protein YesL
MPEGMNRTREAVAAVASPFATASSALLIVLSFVEFFRRGFVSLFLDFRMLAAVALALSIAAVWAEASSGPKWLHAIIVAGSLAAFAPILWRLSEPYGRLGLATFLCGCAALAVIFLSSLKAKR